MSAAFKLPASTGSRPRAGVVRRGPSPKNVGDMSLRKISLTRTLVARAAEPDFDEGAAQVRRLLDRDRKDMDFDELESAFDSDSPASAAQETAADASKPVVSMSTKATISPFGPSSGSLPFEPPARKPSIEPRNLSPDMQPDSLEETPWWTKITLTQVVIVLSFTTIIGLMIATFFVVLNMGAIRLNE